MNFAVWSEQIDQDDLIWYEWKENIIKTWCAEALIENHKTAGDYQVHVYRIKWKNSRLFGIDNV